MTLDPLALLLTAAIYGVAIVGPRLTLWWCERPAPLPRARVIRW